MIRVHTYHATAEAVRWMIQIYGFDATCEIIKQLVKQAGLDPMDAEWSAGAGMGITVRGWAVDVVEA